MIAYTISICAYIKIPRTRIAKLTNKSLFHCHYTVPRKARKYEKNSNILIRDHKKAWCAWEINLIKNKLTLRLRCNNVLQKVLEYLSSHLFWISSKATIFEHLFEKHIAFNEAYDRFHLCSVQQGLFWKIFVFVYFLFSSFMYYVS